MSKVLVERERIGVKGAAVLRRRNRRRHNDKRFFDEASSLGSMGRSRNYGYDAKQLNENLSPLKRFIEANVGRRWDDVYSEIREHVNFANTVQKHILQHLWQYVERNVVMNDKGVACHPPTSFRSWRGGLVALGYDSFFVHPNTGLLSRGAKVKVGPRKAERIKGRRLATNGSGFDEVRLIDGAIYVVEGGIWFSADLRPLPEGFAWGKPVARTRQERRYDAIGGSTVVEVPFFDEGPTDRLLGRKVGHFHRSSFSPRDHHVDIVRRDVERYYGRLTHYCAGKGSQLDTKALRRLGLKNGD